MYLSEKATKVAIFLLLILVVLVGFAPVVDAQEPTVSNTTGFVVSAAEGGQGHFVGYKTNNWGVGVGVGGSRFQGAPYIYQRWGESRANRLYVGDALGLNNVVR